jgi:hypothetical protein
MARRCNPRRQSGDLGRRNRFVTKASETRVSSAQDIALPVFGTINVLAVAIAALFVVPHYIDMFKGFGMDLPHITRLMLATHRWWSLLALVVPALWASWPNPRSRGVASLIAGTILALLLTVFCVWGCNAPLFTLAAVT